MARRLLRRSSPLVVDLSGRHMPMAEQLLNLANIDRRIKQERRGRSSKRVRGVKAASFAVLVRPH